MKNHAKDHVLFYSVNIYFLLLSLQKYLDGLRPECKQVQKGQTGMLVLKHLRKWHCSIKVNTTAEYQHG